MNKNQPTPGASSKTVPTRPILESYWVLPGKFLAGEYPAVSYAPEVTIKRLHAFLDAKFNTFIDLTTPGETVEYASILREEAGYYELKVEYQRFPIGDFGLPTSAAMNATLDAIDAALFQERKIYLHCYGGIGRTGTAVGCYLVRHGYSGEQALAQLAEWWHTVPKSDRYSHSPETPAQEQFILQWARHDSTL